MNHSTQLDLALDLDPLEKIPRGYKKCLTCNLVMPETRQYFAWSTARGVGTCCRLCTKEKNYKYVSTEKGYLHDMFNGVLARQRGKIKGRTIANERNLKMKHTLNTIDKLFAHWENHKRIYGMRCAYTGCILTHIRTNGKSKRTAAAPTNISIDRVHPRIGYTETNTVFCTWDFNDKKGSISPKDCLKVINFCKGKGRYDLL